MFAKNLMGEILQESVDAIKGRLQAGNLIVHWYDDMGLEHGDQFCGLGRATRVMW